MSSSFQAPIGTHDVLAPQSALWEGLVATFAQFAFRSELAAVGYGKLRLFITHDFFPIVFF